MSDGYYVYIETSPLREYGEKARLISPIQNAGKYCLTFWYNMRGKDINRLSVYLKTEFCPEVHIFSKANGTNETNWKRAEISFTSTSEYKVGECLIKR